MAAAASALAQRGERKVRLGDLLEPYYERNAGCRRTLAAVGIHGIRLRSEIFSKEFVKDASKHKLIFKGTLAVGMGSKQMDIGILSEDKCYAISPSYHTYRIHGIDCDYLRYLLEARNPDMSRRFLIPSYRRGKPVDLDRWLDYELLVHDERSQRAVRDVLDKISALKRNAETRLAKLETLVKSRFVEMFGDPVANPKKWPVCALGERCEVITGNTPSHADPGNYGDYIEWIKTDNIVDGHLTTAVIAIAGAIHSAVSLSKKALSRARHVGAGSLLMTCVAGRTGTIGNCAIADREVSFNQQINALTPRVDSPAFLLYLFKLAKCVLVGDLKRCLKGYVSKSGLSAKRFPFPDVALQREFASFAEKVEKLKAEAKRSAEQLDVLYRSKLQDYFG